jgi:hypothetical protein
MHRFLHLAWRGQSGWERYVLTLVVAAVALLLSGFATAAGLDALGATTGGGFTPEGLGIDPVAFLVVALAPFPFVLAALWGCLRGLHRRGLRSLVTPDRRVDAGRLATGAVAWAAVGLAITAGEVAAAPESYRFVVEPGPLAQLTAVAAVLVPLQAATEELFLRGYLLQGAAQGLRRGWAALCATSLLFGVLHGGNAEVAAHGWALAMPYYVGFGLLLGGITLVDDRLELAIGVHVANNLVGTVVVTSPESSLPTPALLRRQAPELSPEALALWGVGAAVFAAAMARRYGWTGRDLRRALGRVAPPGSAKAAPASRQAGP